MQRSSPAPTPRRVRVGRSNRVALLVDAAAFPANLDADLAGGLLDEVAHRVLLAGGDDIALRVVLLEHEPLHAHVVAGMAPIALGVEVAEIQVLP
jgi:hypothetical protein